MKRFTLLAALLILLCLAVPATVSAQDSTTFTWDYADVDVLFLIDEGGGYKLYASKQDAGPYTEIATQFDPTVKQVTVDTSALRGRFYFVVRAFIPTLESDNSNVVSAPFKPEKPSNLQKAP